MKALLIMGFTLIANLNPYNKTSKFTVDIFDYNNSLAYTLNYHVTNDSISIVRLNGLRHEPSICLFQKKLAPQIKCRILDLLLSPTFKTLKNEYKNSLITDGDQKRIVFDINGQKKIITIQNVYNTEIAQLIFEVNRGLKNKFKIKYSKI
jgi:hypothetical protein